MTDSQELIQEEVMSVVDRIENMTNSDELDPLEVTVEADLDGTAREFTLVLTTGGPHIEVDLCKGIVRGYWAGDEHSVPIIDEEADGLLDQMAEHYRQHWNQNVVAN